MAEFTTIAVAYGDGIGPEIMDATLKILKVAEARINIETIEIGEKLYTKGFSSGISKDAWATVKKHKILLKAPITTPQGKGYKSLNVTFRKSLGLFANVRPCVSYFPYVDTKHEKMDLVVVRENEEDLYAGLEYRVSANNNVAYKIITRDGSEKIIRFAFEYAKQNGRKKVTCMIKDNIMKISDGCFHSIFKEVAQEYPDIKADSIIVDIGSARIASRPQDFDVIVTLNLYGDIISDIAAEVSGSVGLAGSANIGEHFAMFEAIHGSAPDIAGKGIANPSGLLNGALMMLDYIGQSDVSAEIKNAWLKTIEDGIHTADIYKEGKSKKKVSTSEFADAVIANLGEKPVKMAVAQARPSKRIENLSRPAKPVDQQLIGVDVYIDAHKASVEEIVAKIEHLDKDLKLHTVSQKGLKIWPDSEAEGVVTDLLQCRFIGFEDAKVSQRQVVDLLDKVEKTGLQMTTVQNLYTYDKVIGFTMSQGE
ncbi:MAG: NADP-dependent isocitrate dehydrogenase [Rickettsiales bacterium]